MKFLFSAALLFAALTSNLLALNQIPEPDTVETLKHWDDLFRYQNYYISGQPELETLKWLKAQGVSKIINLRTENENKEFKEDSFNEKKAAKKMGFEYQSLPISGSSGYTPANLRQFAELLEPGEKVLIHCSSGGRANNLFMAYLVKEEGYSIDRAIDIGKQIKFTLPMEGLLGVDIKMVVEE